MSNLSRKAANSSFAASASILSAGAMLELPSTLTDLSEPIGLVLALVGTVLKLVEFFRRG